MLSALDLARRIEAGELTPAAVLARCADAIAARESEVHAFIALDLDARKAGRRISSGAALAKLPLRGLPVGIKDIFDTADLPTGHGSDIYRGQSSERRCRPVAMVRRAGGIIAGKTATTEFAYLESHQDPQPSNLDHTPGGSSSGSAAAVGAGMLPIALGTQTGGSIVRPAHIAASPGSNRRIASSRRSA